MAAIIEDDDDDKMPELEVYEPSLEELAVQCSLADAPESPCEPAGELEDTCPSPYLPVLDLSVPENYAMMMDSLPLPPPDMGALRAHCGDDPKRTVPAMRTIMHTWMQLAGPPKRPERGYRVHVGNLVAFARDEGNVIKCDVGPDGESGITATLMIFSLFTDRFYDYACIESTNEFEDVRLWGRYDTKWMDAWPGMHKTYEGFAPTGYHCVRDAIVVDCFSAYFLGMLNDEVLPIDPGSYKPSYDNDTGLLTAVEYAIKTDGMGDDEYTQLRAKMMQFVFNAITARESARPFAATEKERIRRESPQVFSNMLAADLSKMRGAKGIIDPVILKVLNKAGSKLTKTKKKKKDNGRNRPKRPGRSKAPHAGPSVDQLD